MGSVVQLILHSGILGEENSENHVALASMLLCFAVFLAVIVLGEAEAEHNPFSECQGDREARKPLQTLLELLLSWEVREELSQSKDREAGPMRGAFASDTRCY